MSNLQQILEVSITALLCHQFLDSILPDKDSITQISFNEIGSESMQIACYVAIRAIKNSSAPSGNQAVKK